MIALFRNRYLTKHEKVYFQSCVMKHVPELPNNLPRASYRTSIILTVGKSGFVYIGANVRLVSYEDNHSCLQDNIDICNVLQGVFGNSSFESTQERRFCVVVAQGDGHSYWSVHVHLVLPVK